MPEVDVAVETLPDSGEGNYLTLSFEINPRAQNVEYRLEVCDDLTSWTASAGAMGMEFDQESELPNGNLQVRWKSKMPLSTLSPVYFARLAVREVN